MAQADIDRLKTSVTGMTNAGNAVEALMRGFAQQVRDAANDPAALQALATEMDSKATQWAQAVTDNTPGGGTPDPNNPQAQRNR